MADWQIVVLVIIGIFVLSMRGRRNPSPGEQQQRRESWGAMLNRKASDHTDYTDPYATQLRADRNPQYMPEINNRPMNDGSNSSDW